MNELFSNMQQKGPAPTGPTWFEKAIEQHNPKLEIRLCQTEVLVYDRLDREITIRQSLN